jgi:glucan phosphoethanolaminetransferase (alkaline phosphatase superfamily)
LDSGSTAVSGPTLSVMEINGTPLHPLVIHAVVVFVPLAALAAIALAVPRYRWLARWPALIFTVIATAATYVARSSGHDLEHERHLESPLVHTHEEWADRLMIAMWVFAVLVLVAFWVLPHVTRLAGGRDREAKIAALEKPLMLLVPLAAIAVLVLVVLTGDAGARAVWQQ